MPDATRPRSAVRILTDAINAAWAQGIPVHCGAELGVRCTSKFSPCWARDPEAPAVSALGAVLLAEQPAETELDAALMAALGVDLAWVCGIEDGIALLPPALQWTDSPAARPYWAAYTMGQCFRPFLMRRSGRELSTSAPVGE